MLRFKEAHINASKYNQFAPNPVSISTVRRTLKVNEIQNYTAASRPYLSPKNMKARFEWATVHENWDEDQWDRVLYTDESSFPVRPTSLKKRIWRKANTKFELRNLVPRFKSGYVVLSECGAFSACGWTPFDRINGTFKQRSYKEILDNYVLPFAVEKYGSTSDFVFQQDNCGPHKAKFIASHLNEDDVNAMK